MVIEAGYVVTEYVVDDEFGEIAKIVGAADYGDVDFEVFAGSCAVYYAVEEVDYGEEQQMHPAEPWTHVIPWEAQKELSCISHADQIHATPHTRVDW